MPQAPALPTAALTGRLRMKGCGIAHRHCCFLYTSFSRTASRSEDKPGGASIERRTDPPFGGSEKMFKGLNANGFFFFFTPAPICSFHSSLFPVVSECSQASCVLSARMFGRCLYKTTFSKENIVLRYSSKIPKLLTLSEQDIKHYKPSLSAL